MTNAAPEAAMSEAQQGVEDEEGSFETQGAFSARPDAQFDLDAGCFSSNDFRIWRFKVSRCPRARPHDWTQCPFSHPGEKARRRDPSKYCYSGTACPEFRRNGACRRGDLCPFAHGVFECWLHPGRFRTQMCTDGTACKRRVCFFAHTLDELRKPEEDPVWVETQLAFERAAAANAQGSLMSPTQLSPDSGGQLSSRVVGGHSFPGDGHSSSRPHLTPSLNLHGSTSSGGVSTTTSSSYSSEGGVVSPGVGGGSTGGAAAVHAGGFGGAASNLSHGGYVQPSGAVSDGGALPTGGNGHSSGRGAHGAVSMGGFSAAAAAAAAAATAAATSLGPPHHRQQRPQDPLPSSYALASAALAASSGLPNLGGALASAPAATGSGASLHSPPTGSRAVHDTQQQSLAALYQMSLMQSLLTSMPGAAAPPVSAASAVAATLAAQAQTSTPSVDIARILALTGSVPPSLEAAAAAGLLGHGPGGAGLTPAGPVTASGHTLGAAQQLLGQTQPSAAALSTSMGMLPLAPGMDATTMLALQQQLVMLGAGRGAMPGHSHAQAQALAAAAAAAAAAGASVSPGATAATAGQTRPASSLQVPAVRPGSSGSTAGRTPVHSTTPTPSGPLPSLNPAALNATGNSGGGALADLLQAQIQQLASMGLQAGTMVDESQRVTHDLNLGLGHTRFSPSPPTTGFNNNPQHHQLSPSEALMNAALAAAVAQEQQQQGITAGTSPSAVVPGMSAFPTQQGVGAQDHGSLHGGLDQITAAMLGLPPNLLMALAGMGPSASSLDSASSLGSDGSASAANALSTITPLSSRPGTAAVPDAVQPGGAVASSTGAASQQLDSSQPPSPYAALVAPEAVSLSHLAAILASTDDATLQQYAQPGVLPRAGSGDTASPPPTQQQQQQAVQQPSTAVQQAHGDGGRRVSDPVNPPTPLPATQAGDAVQVTPQAVQDPVTPQPVQAVPMMPSPDSAPATRTAGASARAVHDAVTPVEHSFGQDDNQPAVSLHKAGDDASGSSECATGRAENQAPPTGVPAASDAEGISSSTTQVSGTPALPPTTDPVVNAAPASNSSPDAAQGVTLRALSDTIASLLLQQQQRMLSQQQVPANGSGTPAAGAGTHTLAVQPVASSGAMAAASAVLAPAAAGSDTNTAVLDLLTQLVALVGQPGGTCASGSAPAGAPLAAALAATAAPAAAPPVAAAQAEGK